MSEELPKFPFFAKFINGIIAAFIGTTCTFPFDLAKTRNQNIRQFSQEKMHVYKKMANILKKIYIKEGFVGFYGGSLFNILLVFPDRTMKLCANDYFRFKYRKPDGKLTVLRQILAAYSAGALQIMLTVPIEVCKVQIQDAGRIAKTKSEARIRIRDIVKDRLHEKGIRGMYKGFVPTALRDTIFNLVYFPMFAFLNSLGPRRNESSSEAVSWWTFISGFSSASCAAVAGIPADVMKTRLQILRRAEGEEACITMLQCVAQTYQMEGPKAFFKGALFRVHVHGPLFGIAHTVYLLGVGETVVKYLQ